MEFRNCSVRFWLFQFRPFSTTVGQYIMINDRIRSKESGLKLALLMIQMVSDTWFRLDQGVLVDLKG